MKKPDMFARWFMIGELLQFEIEFENDFLLTIWPKGDVELSKMENPANQRWTLFAEGKVVGNLEDIEWSPRSPEIPAHMHMWIKSALRSVPNYPVGLLWIKYIWSKHHNANSNGNQTEGPNETTAGPKNLDG